MSYRVVWGILLAVLAWGAMAVAATPARLTLRCPAYLLPGHRNVLHYRLTGETAAVMGRLTVYPIATNGTVARTPLVSMPVRVQPGGARVIHYRGTGLPPRTARYRVCLTVGGCRAEATSDVKAWDLIGCIVDPVTEEEIRQIDKARDEVPEGYNPDEDPYNDDEADNGFPGYCIGVDAASITAQHIAAKAWYGDQPESAARRLYITPGVSTDRISPRDWVHVWGKSPVEKKWYDDRGAALYTLNGVFFTTNPGQHLTVKVFVGRRGALDNAGQEFDTDDTTPQREGTIISTLTIDGHGRTTGNYFRAAPHKSPSNYRAQPPPPRPPQLTRFQRFYPIYRAHIADILAEREQREAEFFQQGLARTRTAETRLNEHEAELLTQLRTRAQHSRDHQLSFDGEVLEGEVCLPSSDAAARIVTQLLQENLVTPQQVLGRVGPYPEFLSPAWIKLVGDFQRDAKPPSDIWRVSTTLLYRAGVDEAVNRQVLEPMATAGDVDSLNYLFFTRDREMGLPRARVSDANDALLAQLAGTASPPGIRAECAAYAAATGKMALAETIGAEMCALRYVGTKNEAHTYPEQDRALSHARRDILYTLFYQVRTEKAFRIILERSDASRAKRFSNPPMPAVWKDRIEYPLAESECELADGMIYGLKSYMKQHPEAGASGTPAIPVGGQ